MNLKRVKGLGAVSALLATYGCTESAPTQKPSVDELIGSTGEALGEQFADCVAASNAAFNAGVFSINAATSSSGVVIVATGANKLTVNGYTCKQNGTAIPLSSIKSLAITGPGALDTTTSDTYVLDFTAGVGSAGGWSNSLLGAGNISINGGRAANATVSDTIIIKGSSNADNFAAAMNSSTFTDSTTLISLNAANFSTAVGTILVSNVSSTNVFNGGTAPQFVFAMGSGNDTFSAMGFNAANNPVAFGVSINGGLGDDMLIGGPGNDSIQGGGGNDTVSYAAKTAPVYVDMDSTLPSVWGANLWGVSMHHEALIIDIGNGTKHTVTFGTESTPADIVAAINAGIVAADYGLGPYATLVGNRLRLTAGTGNSYLAIDTGSTAAPKLGVGTGLVTSVPNDGTGGVYSRGVLGTVAGWVGTTNYTTSSVIIPSVANLGGANGTYWLQSTVNYTSNANGAYPELPLAATIGATVADHTVPGTSAWTIGGRWWVQNSVAGIYSIGDVVPDPLAAEGADAHLWQLTGLTTGWLGVNVFPIPAAPVVASNYAAVNFGAAAASWVDGDNPNLTWVCQNTAPEWQANHVYAAGSYVAANAHISPAVGNVAALQSSSHGSAITGSSYYATANAFYIYQAVRAGRTSTTEPTWNSAFNSYGIANAVLTDGTIAWSPVASYPSSTTVAINQGQMMGVTNAASGMPGCVYEAYLNGAAVVGHGNLSAANIVTGLFTDGSLTVPSVAYLWTYLGGFSEQDDVQNTPNLTGGSGNDVLQGNTKANIINGGNGDDTISGGPIQNVASNTVCGNTADTLIGGNGDDWFDMGGDEMTVQNIAAVATPKLQWYDCNQNISGGSGNDVLDYSKRSSNSMVKVTIASANSGGDQNQTVPEKDVIGSDVEVVLGGQGNDTITGSNAADCLFGGPGVDHIYGGGGNDFIWGGSGNDFLYGDTGDDTFYEMATYQSANSYDDPLGSSMGVLTSNYSGIGLMIYGSGSTFFNSDSPGAGDDNILGGTTPATENDHLDFTVESNPVMVALCTANSLSDTSWNGCNSASTGYIYMSCDGTVANTHPGDVNTAGGCENNYANIEYVSGSFTQQNVILGTPTNAEQIEGGQGQDFLDGNGGGDWVYGYGANPTGLSGLPQIDTASQDFLCGGGSSYVWGGTSSYEEGEGALTLAGNSGFAWNGIAFSVLSAATLSGSPAVANSLSVASCWQDNSGHGANVDTCVGGGNASDCY